jgi:hypothetical protein
MRLPSGVCSACSGERHVLQARPPHAYCRAAPVVYDGCDNNAQEKTMSMQAEGKDAQGRNYDQVTKDGTGSVGSVGPGGTGDIGRMSGTAADDAQAGGAGAQPGGRTDDLLSSDADTDAASDGFVGEQAGAEAGELRTGMEGIGSLSTGNAGSRRPDSATDSDKS